jgi:hypothetical protein
VIDVTTVLAILSDYDLSDPMQLRSAQDTLEILKATVPEDEQTGFDPSGAGGVDSSIDEQDANKGKNKSTSARSLPASGWKSQTDDSSLSQELSSLDLEGHFTESNYTTSREESLEKSYTSELDVLDNDGKEKALVGIFPTLKPFDIRWTLKKCKGDASLAIDELMTQSFLEESGSRHRGIEAFSESEVLSRPRKGKGKKKRIFQTHEDISSSTSKSPSESKWETGRQDIEFLARYTGMPLQQISSMYHENGASVHATISAIIKAHLSMKIETDDPMIQVNAFELRQDFPAISSVDLDALLQLTHPSITDARELAKALTTRPANKESPIQIEFRHTPIQLDPEPIKPAPKPHNAVHPFDVTVATYAQGRDTAFSQAKAAFRKGKSDPLMGRAAAYYSQVGRDLDARAKSLESAAADIRVANQSTRLELDLHGCNVKDAVRIAREGVTTWWHELGGPRAGGRGVGPSYRVVVGAGRHSEGGKGKLGPAVGKMLIREGWKIEVGPTYLVVTGTVKRA